MKIKNLFAASLIPLNTLLLFLLLFEGRLVVPVWLQVIGRMHPLVLHFPIVLILLYAVFLLFTPKAYREESAYGNISDWLVLCAALTAAITALMGLFLSREPGYDKDALALHKYTGIFTSFLLFVFFNVRRRMEKHLVISKLYILLTAGVVVWAGHLGGNITHGESFVLSPVIPQHKPPQVPLEEAVIFADVVRPILETKCMSCHNNGKAKGELVMETKELLLKGGKNGKLWDTSQQNLGLLMHRIHLPLENKEHMPPKSKPQLTDQEMAILYAWIKGGAQFEKMVIELPSSDTLRILASKVLKPSTDEQYQFAAADEKQIRSLSNDNRVIAPLALTSPALVVNFYNKAFYNSQSLKELKPLAGQIVSLNLDNMPVKDEDLAIIAGFTNLRRLNLNFTSVTGATLAQLRTLQYLRSLSLSGTAVKANQLIALSNLPKLRNVYLWNTPVTTNDITQLEKQNKNIVYQTGFRGSDTMILKLTPPIFENEDQVIFTSIPLKLKHYINGTNINYTIDGKDPDSVASPVYQKAIDLDAEVTVKAKAWKHGWLSSDVVTQHFFKSTYKADSAMLETKPDVNFRGEGGKTIIDREKSDINFASGRWLGYKDTPVKAILLFNKPVTASGVTFSTLTIVGRAIFPPAKVTVWGSMDNKSWTLLNTVSPQQPVKKSNVSENLAVTCNFKPTQVKYIKLLVQPVARLPVWHQGKGGKAWVFVDEVFIN